MSINYTRDASDQLPDVGDIRTDDRFADIHSKLDGVFEVVNKLNQLLTVTSTDVKEIKFLLNEVASKQQASQETQTLPQEQLNQTSNLHGSNNIVSSAVDLPQALDFQKLKPSDASTPLASPFKHEESKQSQLKASAKTEATLTTPEKNEAKFFQIEASAKNEAKELEAEPTSTKKAVPNRSHIQLDTTDEAFDGKMKELLFKRECKLFTFVRETKETFLRGHGIIYVVYHRNTNIFKVFMKRNNDQKICAVFKIRRNMQLSDKSGSKSTGSAF
uniref:RanBD1 domain-containing protein n=1 Tax=Panagrolaimus superbus TaxID=310955 RepID=A0A914XUC8_9BILA